MKSFCRVQGRFFQKESLAARSAGPDTESPKFLL
jgi:hypothetical protein